MNELLESKTMVVAKRDLPKRDSQVDKLSLEIFEHWNSKGIMVHRKCSRRIPLILKRITEDFTKEEIMQSIDNYATVYHDSNYYFNYKWNLETFLQKSNTLPDFMNDGSKWLSYIEVIIPKSPVKKELPMPILELDDDPFIASNDAHFIKDTYPLMINIFRTMPYSEYLQTEHWLHFREQALRNAQFRCRVCNTKDAVLDVHHNNYENRGRETFNDIVVLCESCHAKFHNKDKEIWL